ncbi:restriction endonuclease [uncultured Polaribacter sp.]|uniref:restriction endonuclease n=1 Tax=uncultured Polaribacter sp. TaxID=174711 RepID=UPI00261B2B03|nr:restriction endonuclease [uncultured Polaribacter sp.]
METYIQTGLGIIVSVLLFLVGYRQTIGARKERIKASNEKMLETILRRVILEKYEPKRNDIKRLIEGKARDYKVKQKDLLNVDQILNTIYTRIFENDLISPEQRAENIERLGNLFVVDKKENKPELEQMLIRNKDTNKKVFNSLTIILGILSSIIGVSIVSFDKLVDFDTSLNSNVIFTMLASILSILTVYIFIKFKDNQESSEENDTPRKAYKTALRFEKEVIQSIKSKGLDLIIPNDKDFGFDLITIIKGEKVGIQIKYWRNRPPFSYLRQLVSRMKSSMNKENVQKGFIVTNDTHDIEKKIKFENGIELLSISELKNRLG